MRRHRGKLIPLEIAAVLLILTVATLWNAYRDARWRELNRALIVAITKHDTGTAISMVAKGADANSTIVSPDRRSLSQRFWDLMLGRRASSTLGRTALLFAVQGSNGEGLYERSGNTYVIKDFPENLPVVKALIDSGAEVNTRSPRGRTPLLSALVLKHDDTVRLLLDSGADPNLVDGETYGNSSIQPNWFARRLSGGTALQYAFQLRDHVAMVQLIEHGADINVRYTYDGATLVMDAAGAYDGSREVQFLIAHGANVNACDSTGRTALMLASSCRYPEPGEILKIPSAVAADDNVLPAARTVDYVRVVQYLTAAGAAVNARDHQGQTALLYSLVGPRENVSMVKALLSMGADPNLRSNAGKSALSFARAENYAASIRVLKNAGATN